MKHRIADSFRHFYCALDLFDLLRQKNVDRAYVITKSLEDFGAVADLLDTATHILRIPASLLCYWMGESVLTLEQQ